MNRSIFMLGELISGFESRAWIFSILAIVAILMVSIVLAVLMSVIQPDQNPVGARLVIEPSSTVQSDVEVLMERLEMHPSVSGIKLLSSANVGQTIEVQLYPEVAAVQGHEQLSLITGVAGISIPQAAPEGGLKTFLGNSFNLILLLVGLGILFSGMIVLIYLGLHAAKQSFSSDIEILEQVGVSPGLLRLPFSLFGGLIGFCGAILTLLFAYSMAIWLPVLGFASQFVPELMKAGMIEQMAVRGVVIALLIGILFCLSIGFLTYRYPKPFSRSLSSSSSLSVSAG